MSDADIGYQSRFRIGNFSIPPTFTTVADVVNFTPPSLSFGEVQTTTLDTPGATHTYRPTLADPGEVPVTINYKPGGTEESVILAIFDRSTRPFEIEFPNGAKQQFSGFAKGFEPSEVGLEELLQASFTVRVSGKPTYVAAPAPTAPANSVLPAISGTAQVGSPLTVSTGTWSGGPTPWFAYQWKAAGTVITGATGTLYVPVTADIGKTIRCEVMGYNQSGTVVVQSAATAAVIA